MLGAQKLVENAESLALAWDDSVWRNRKSPRDPRNAPPQWSRVIFLIRIGQIRSDVDTPKLGKVY